MSQDIAFIGKMRSGKDTAAARLIEVHDYQRLAFADPVRELALKLDPWITYANDDGDWLNGISAIRLSELVDRVGWDRAKDEHPEVRRTLQHAGQGVRDLDPSFWIFELLRKYRAAKPDPVVITDVRYRNEARTLRKRGFKLVRIVRPLARGEVSARHLDPAKQHASETELDDYPCDVVISNSGSLADLHAAVDALALGA
jgi:dephospho-CoA kinase